MTLQQIPAKLSLIADEFSATLNGQIAAAKRIGVAAIDLRSVGDCNVIDLSQSALCEAVARIQGEGLHVASLASALGKRRETPHFMAERLQILHEVAVTYGIANIRIFGRMPPDDHSGETPLTWLQPLAVELDDTPVEWVIEPELGTGITDPMIARSLIANTGIRNLKLVWDSANFVKLGYHHPFTELFESLAPYIGHVHVKDFDLDLQQPCPAGEGAGQITELIGRLQADQYSGWIALEPQLVRNAARFVTPLSALSAAADGLLACWRQGRSA